MQDYVIVQRGLDVSRPYKIKVKVNHKHLFLVLFGDQDGYVGFVE